MIFGLMLINLILVIIVVDSLLFAFLLLYLMVHLTMANVVELLLRDIP